MDLDRQRLKERGKMEQDVDSIKRMNQTQARCPHKNKINAIRMLCSKNRGI